VRFGKIIGVVIVVTAVGSAKLMIQSQRPIFLSLLSVYGYFAPGITTIFLLGILWKRTTRAGALAAGILTIPLSFLLDFLWPNMPFMNRTGIVFWICMTTAVGVSLLTEPETEERLKGLIWNKESLVLPEEQRAQMRGWRNPMLWAVIANVLLILLYIRYH
jgi:SSS family solute:Na+ symporter